MTQEQEYKQKHLIFRSAFAAALLSATVIFALKAPEAVQSFKSWNPGFIKVGNVLIGKRPELEFIYGGPWTTRASIDVRIHLEGNHPSASVVGSFNPDIDNHLEWDFGIIINPTNSNKPYLIEGTDY